MPFWKWSRTRIVERHRGQHGQLGPRAWRRARSTISARAMMARLAEWRDDVSGTIAIGRNCRTSTAYTLASNQVFDNFADMNGAMIAFVPHTTNSAGCTLNVDGLGAKALAFGPNFFLQSGVLIQGTPYVASYNNADQNCTCRAASPIPTASRSGG